ncbi:MAG: lamin tail domain-containing protein [Roseibacillus sp.]|nr:lamin tail domain-containing protein [Roseibacillus sp.]
MNLPFPCRAYALLLLLSFLVAGLRLLPAADSVIVFNEVHYHPADEDNDTEWVELRSLMGVDVDISDWELEGGINYRFANGTVVPGRGFLLVAADPSHPSLEGRGALGPFSGRLANNGESIRLVNNNDRTMDELGYGDDGDWPVGADGLGSTLSKRNEHTAESRPFNWVASPGSGGTPGLPNFPDDPGGESIRDIVFSEIAGGNAPGFQVELTNVGSDAIALSGYQLRSSTGATQQIPAVLLEPGAYLAITPSFPVADGHRLSLLRSGTDALADAREVTNRLRGLSNDRWLYPDAPTFGAPNSYSFNNDIVINEIMYNPRPLPATRPSTPDILVDWNHSWRYNESGSDLGNNWEDSPHQEDGITWLSGPGPLGVETASLTNAIATPLSPLDSRDPRTITFYFETNFEVTGQQKRDTTRLELTHQIDDGAIFYLNGTEIERYQVGDEPITASSTASDTTGDATVITTLLPTSTLAALQEGSNRLSVEVHQTSAGSSDIVMGMQLIATQEGLPVRRSNEQWIELYNRGAEAVNLDGWEFNDGISFEFPPDTILPAGEFLVVAREAASLAAKYPDITIAGSWNGNLSRKGERISLIDGSRNIADEVRYSDGGRWPGRADAAGSSLELRDPHADNSSPEAWASSIEDAPWQEITYLGRGSFTPSNDPTQYHEMIFGLLDAGEFLIDDISVIESPGGTARELIQNGTFPRDFSTWRMRGNHRHARVVPDPDNPANKVLHVRATGAMEHMHNHAETTLKAGGSFVSLSNSQIYQISFRARWISGSNQLNTRLYFNRMPRTHLLEAPLDCGTPGAPNSRITDNAGPTYTNLRHSPAVPRANQSASVEAAISDPDGIASVTLFYSVNGGSFRSTAMRAQGNGSYRGTVPRQSGGRKVQFYLVAEDTLGATQFIPAGGPDARALIPWDDGQANLDFGNCQPNNFRIVMTTDDTAFMHNVTEVMSNDRLGCTIIYNEKDIYYDCGVRLKGSQRGRAKDVRVGFTVGFPDNQPFLGAHETVAVDRSGAGDQFSQKEMLVKHIINRAGGIPCMQDDLIRVIAPRSNHTGSAILLKSRFDGEWLENQFPGGADGTLFEYELIYYPTSTTGGPEGLKRPNPDSVRGVAMRPTGGRRDKENYRYHWQIDNNRDTDDYDGIINALNTLSLNGTSFRDASYRDLDVDQWLRAFAAQVLCGIGDNYSSGSQHNALFYVRPTDNRVMYFPWDMDFSFNRGSTSGLTPNGDLSKLLSASPANERAYYGHIKDIIDTAFNSRYLTRWTNHYSCFLPSENLGNHLSYIISRRNHALNAINSAVSQTPFRITTSGGSTTNQSFIALRGDAWVDVREIRLAGATGPLSVTWIDDNSWEVNVPVNPGPNAITLQAIGFRENVLSERTVNVTGTSALVPATSATLAISEIMYHPGAPTSTEMQAGFTDQDDFEFIEIANLSETLTIDLTGLRFTDGIDYQFPESTLAPGARGLLVGREAGFTERYGSGQPVIGSYQSGDSNKLANQGEHLVLLDASGTPIADFTWSHDPPWPTSADGLGYSLVLMCPGTNDPSLPESWRTSTLPGGHPNASDTIDLTEWMNAGDVTDLLSDDDNDGLAALLEFAGGQDPNRPETAGLVAISMENDENPHPVISFRQRIGADAIDFSAEESTNLTNWTAGPTYLGRVNNGDGTSSVLFRGSQPASGAETSYLRIVASEKPTAP